LIVHLPLPSLRPTAALGFNLTQIAYVGQQWSSNVLTDFAKRLASNASSANAGKVMGNRMFFSNDYMVRFNTPARFFTVLKLFLARCTAVASMCLH
jgi:hypothetical protein